jgi:hypothetical protein
MKAGMTKGKAVRIIKIAIFESRENGCVGTVKKLEEIVNWLTPKGKKK